jgi:Cdc6-like AAA superfamily ATPase
MSRENLIRIIKHYQLDIRFSHWKEHLFMVENEIYSDDFCKLLIDEARTDGEKIQDTGNMLDRPPSKEELGDYEIEFGNTKEGEKNRIGICFKSKPKNILILSAAGFGKTVCTKNICIKVDKANETQKDNPTLLCIIDLKNDYVDLKEKLNGSTVIYSVHDTLKIGLNAPENVSPYVWMGQMSLSLAGRIGIITARTVLTLLMARLLLLLNPGLKEGDLNNPTVSKQLIWPPLELILKITKHGKIMNLFSSKDCYSQSLMQSLEGLLQDSGILFSCCNGFDINRTFEKKQHCIIHAPNTPAHVTHIVTDTIINQVLVKRLAENYKTDHTDILFVLDESDLLLESDNSNFSDLSPIEKLFRLGREMGLMSCVCISGI